MKFVYVIRIKEDNCIGVFSLITNDFGVLEECETLVSLGYDIVEIYRLCRFDGLKRPLMLLTANVPMSYEEFCEEALCDE